MQGRQSRKQSMTRFSELRKQIKARYSIDETETPRWRRRCDNTTCETVEYERYSSPVI